MVIYALKFFLMLVFLSLLFYQDIPAISYNFP